MEVITTKSSIPWVTLWTLNVYGRKFYLGQDVKFCHRILNMDPGYVVKQIGSNDIRKKTVNERLAKLICNELGIDRKTVMQFEPWALAAD